MALTKKQFLKLLGLSKDQVALYGIRQDGFADTIDLRSIKEDGVRLLAKMIVKDPSLPSGREVWWDSDSDYYQSFWLSIDHWLTGDIKPLIQEDQIFKIISGEPTNINVFGKNFLENLSVSFDIPEVSVSGSPTPTSTSTLDVVLTSTPSMGGETAIGTISTSLEAENKIKVILLPAKPEVTELQEFNVPAGTSGDINILGNFFQPVSTSLLTTNQDNWKGLKTERVVVIEPTTANWKFDLDLDTSLGSREFFVSTDSGKSVNSFVLNVENPPAPVLNPSGNEVTLEGTDPRLISLYGDFFVNDDQTVLIGDVDDFIIGDVVVASRTIIRCYIRPKEDLTPGVRTLQVQTAYGTSSNSFTINIV